MASLTLDVFLRIFDEKIEPKLLFDDPQECFSNNTARNLLQAYLEDDSLKGWKRLAILTRWMILADRTLELRQGPECLKFGLPIIEQLYPHSPEERYEQLRFYNTCGLIYYRCGDYPRAQDYFKQAHTLSTNKLEAFKPDMCSNVLRTEHELFARTWPKFTDPHSRNYVTEKYNKLIDGFDEAIADAESMQINIGDEYWIFYCHGMASLFHNKGEILSFLSNNGREDQKEAKRGDALRSHESSLSWGEKSGDSYRILQSKRFIAEMDPTKTNYSDDVRDGKWVRGVQMVLQQALKKETNEKEIAALLENLKTQTDFPDQIVLLHNLRAIKTKRLKSATAQKLFPKRELLMRIVEVLSSFREQFSFLIYRRNAMRDARGDFRDLVQDCWDSGEYKDALAWLERSVCREIFELSYITTGAVADSITQSNREAINRKKLEIYQKDLERIREGASTVGIGDPSSTDKLEPPSLSLAYSPEDMEANLPLTLAYEDALSSLDLFNDSVIPILDKPIVPRVMERLKDISQSAYIAIVRLVKMGDSIGLCLMDSEGRFMHPKKEFAHSALQDLAKCLTKYADERPARNQMGAFSREMCPMAKALDLPGFLPHRDGTGNRKKVLFFIPDADTLSLPLHLLGPNGSDLRSEEAGAWDVYYCPSLNILLHRPEPGGRSEDRVRAGVRHLWIHAPTHDLQVDLKYPLDRPGWLPESDLACLHGNDATLQAFWAALESYRPTHLGLSTHGKFNDHTMDAYLSRIFFADNFLTAYDILLGPNLSGIQTVLLGACEVGSSEQSEAVGLITAFMTRGVKSTIGALWKISKPLHNDLLEVLPRIDVATNPGPWNISELRRRLDAGDGVLTPFVQFATLGILE